MHSNLRLAAALLAAPASISAQTPDFAAQAGQPSEPQEIVVVGVPLSGGIPVDRIPAHIHTLGRAALDVPGTATLNDVLNRRVGGVAAFDSLGNPLQGGLTMRGFTAAPALGTEDPFSDLAKNELPYELVVDGVLSDGLGLELVCQWTSPLGTAFVWYRFLNIGRAMPATSGTDMMANFYRAPAIGTARAYVPATNARGRNDSAVEQVRSGKGFVTTGPALLFAVDEKQPGGIVSSGDRAWSLELISMRPVDRVEIIVNGQVVQTLKGFGGNGNKKYSGKVTLPTGGWIAARAIGGETAWPIMSYTHFAHTQPVWIGRVGSTEPGTARAAAKDLLWALTYSENKFTESYGNAVPPGLGARIAETRRRLSGMAKE